MSSVAGRDVCVWGMQLSGAHIAGCTCDVYSPTEVAIDIEYFMYSKGVIFLVACVKHSSLALPSAMATVGSRYGMCGVNRNNFLRVQI